MSAGHADHTDGVSAGMDADLQYWNMLEVGRLTRDPEVIGEYAARRNQ